MNRMRITLFIVATSWLTVLAHASAITDSLLRDQLIGRWADMGDCEHGALTFNADGTFALSGDDPPTDEKGTFDVKDGKLSGKSDKRNMPTVDIVFDDATLVLGPDRLGKCKAT